jgi:Flp pilus assembly protein TadD
MKSKLITALLVMLLAVVGCSSSGSKSNGTDEKLATISTMMAKGYSMTQNQREKITQLTAEGKELVAQGKKEEADKLFNEAIQLLEVIAETDRFNKSE